MKVYVHEGELWPCYRVSETQIGDEEIEVTEEELANWRKVREEFFHAQDQIRQKIAQFKTNKFEREMLESFFNREHPSRQDKAYILKRFGWTQTDTSVWEYKGREARLYEAFEECRQIYESSKND